jgi:uncharacterized membrane protein YkvA (DUF1232 family)
MPLDITFTLSDNDLTHFQQVVDRARSASKKELQGAEIVQAAQELIEKANAGNLPDFIAERISKLHVITDMLSDSEWQLGTADRERVLGALLYFCDPDDLIPDDVPGLGFLDDAIYIELLMQQLGAEVGSYEEFCQFRAAEEERRRNKGLDPHVQREDWLAEKRMEIHAEMKSRRHRLPSPTGWRLRW